MSAMRVSYTCQQCGGRFTYNPHAQVRCAALHPPGECCHYGEIDLDDEELD